MRSRRRARTPCPARCRASLPRPSGALGIDASVDGATVAVFFHAEEPPFQRHLGTAARSADVVLPDRRDRDAVVEEQGRLARAGANPAVVRAGPEVLRAGRRLAALPRRPADRALSRQRPAGGLRRAAGRDEAVLEPVGPAGTAGRAGLAGLAVRRSSRDRVPRPTACGDSARRRGAGVIPWASCWRSAPWR